MPSSYGKPLPEITPLNHRFWEFARGHELRFQKCRRCLRWIYPISVQCQWCWSDDLAWERVSGLGSVTSWVVYHRAFQAGFENDVPYCVVQVQLDEGFSLISNPVDIEIEEVRIGLRVSARFEDVTDEITLVKFAPCESGV
jgi:uncharacterized OB-fold protein